jgi:hypothetical protein
MAWKWFVQTNDIVDGPFSTEDVQARLQGGDFAKNSLIWGPGTDSWQNMTTWLQSLTGLQSSGPSEMMFEAWHFAVAGQSRGPMSREQMINEIKNLGGGDVMVWTKGMKEWAPLFEFHDLLNEVGINKRQFPRAELAGKAVIRSNGNVLIAPLLSISEGGFGVALENGLVSGESVTAELQSQVFREALHVKADVRYVGQGVIGFKFTQVNVETRGAIIQFIKQHQVRFPIRAA